MRPNYALRLLFLLHRLQFYILQVSQFHCLKYLNPETMTHYLMNHLLSPLHHLHL
ncbi:hypothetical protein V6Z12_D01G211900 [Gossypium hirsutum]